MKLIRRLAVSLVLALVFIAAGGLAFIYTGIYDIAARHPHLGVVHWALSTMQRNSVRAHAKGITSPPLDDPSLVREGLALYRDLCVVCHGAPGVSRGREGVGLNPNPPPLLQASLHWSDAELFWITSNGLKMAGMPAFGLGGTDEQLWSLVAFIRRLRRTTPAEYRRMVEALEGRLDPAGIEWIPVSDGGWKDLRESGDAARGAALIRNLGCGSCHVVPGVRGARGTAGPPLTHFARRHFIAGSLLNEPQSLSAWLIGPHRIAPATAMPDLGLTPEQALDVAAYLYSIR